MFLLAFVQKEKHSVRYSVSLTHTWLMNQFAMHICVNWSFVWTPTCLEVHTNLQRRCNANNSLQSGCTWKRVICTIDGWQIKISGRKEVLVKKSGRTDPLKASTIKTVVWKLINVYCLQQMVYTRWSVTKHPYHATGPCTHFDESDLRWRKDGEIAR